MSEVKVGLVFTRQQTEDQRSLVVKGHVTMGKERRKKLGRVKRFVERTKGNQIGFTEMEEDRHGCLTNS